MRQWCIKHIQSRKPTKCWISFSTVFCCSSRQAVLQQRALTEKTSLLLRGSEGTFTRVCFQPASSKDQLGHNPCDPVLQVQTHIKQTFILLTQAEKYIRQVDLECWHRRVWGTWDDNKGVNFTLCNRNKQTPGPGVHSWDGVLWDGD